MDPFIMLQRQMEVAGALRIPPKTPQELMATRATMKELSTFITQISRLATRLQLPLESVFQCLMQLGLGSSSGVSFDKQHSQGNVPMHQAKVLDRNAALNAQNVTPKIREAVDSDVLASHVSHCATLRSLLRMKVEDGNDLSMARKLVSLAEEYLDHIFNAAGGDAGKMMQLYLADDDKAILKLTSCSSTESPLLESGTSDTLSASLVGLGNTKSLPGNVARGIRDECHGVLDSLKPEFAKRQQALVNICAWVQLIQDEAFTSLLAQDLFATLSEPIKAQTGDKRSAVCRLACDIISHMCLRSPQDVFHSAKVRDVILGWLEVLLKGVHVTVAAIAEATDLTVRDVVISTRGSSCVLSALTNALVKAAQPELRRKVLNYLVLAVVVHPTKLLSATQSGEASCSVLSSVVPVAIKMCTSSEEPCRRAARVLIIALASKGVRAPSVDPKVDRAIQQDTAAVGDTVSTGDVGAVETAVLGYPTPSRGAAGGKSAPRSRGSTIECERSPPKRLVSDPSLTAATPVPPSAEKSSAAPSGLHSSKIISSHPTVSNPSAASTKPSTTSIQEQARAHTQLEKPKTALASLPDITNATSLELVPSRSSALPAMPLSLKCGRPSNSAGAGGSPHDHSLTSPPAVLSGSLKKRLVQRSDSTVYQ